MTSVFPRKADILRVRRHVSKVPLSEVKWTSFDHLVGAGKQRGWDCETERFGGPQIDHEIKFGRLLNWDVGRLCTAQNLVDIVGGAPP